MEKMHKAFEKVKLMVGMEVEEDEPRAAALEESNSFAFVDEFNRNCTLSTKQVIFPINLGQIISFPSYYLRFVTEIVLQGAEMQMLLFTTILLISLFFFLSRKEIRLF